MPIYEYECGICHFHFEKKQGFDDEPVAVCPECQGEAHRIICSIPVIFKGKGFYVTDNRKAEPPKMTDVIDRTPAKPKNEGKEG